MEAGRGEENFEEDGQIISRETIEKSLDGGEGYRILANGRKVGGVVLRTDGERGELELLFTLPEVHGRGIGQAAWRAVEALHSEVRAWETVTPYFEKRNIHFYVNKCGFRIVEFSAPATPTPTTGRTGTAPRCSVSRNGWSGRAVFGNLSPQGGEVRNSCRAQTDRRG